MAPIDINDWWLAAAAAAATGLGAPSATAATEVGAQVGVVTSMRAGVVSATNERVVYIGNSVAYGERFRTDGSGIIHILFMDQSSMTLGPNSELVIGTHRHGHYWYSWRHFVGRCAGQSNRGHIPVWRTHGCSVTQWSDRAKGHATGVFGNSPKHRHRRTI